MHITGLFVGSWGAHFMISGIFYCTNVMRYMENSFGSCDDLEKKRSPWTHRSMESMGLCGISAHVPDGVYGAGPGIRALRFWWQILARPRPGKNDVCHADNPGHGPFDLVADLSKTTSWKKMLCAMLTNSVSQTWSEGAEPVN